jgi:hypothetical protein
MKRSEQGWTKGKRMMKLLPSFKAQRENEQRTRLYRDLLHREAKIGGELFGPVQPGGRREFFCLDEHTWIWHEEWVDQKTDTPRAVTTRYNVRPNGILKAQGNQSYRYIDQAEARKLYQAAQLYRQRVFSEIYGVAV